MHHHLFYFLKTLAIPAALYLGMIVFTVVSERREKAKFDERMETFNRGFKAGHEHAEKDAERQRNDRAAIDS